MKMGMEKIMTKTRPTYRSVEILNWPEQSFSRNRKYHAQMSWHALVTKSSLEWNIKVIEYKNTVIKDATECEQGSHQYKLWNSYMSS